MPDEESLGPALRALTPKQRRFVFELYAGPTGYGSLIRAARVAYGMAGSRDALYVQASQTLRDDKVQAALRELGNKIITAEAFQSIKNISRVAADPKHRDFLRANALLLDRGFPAETFHTVKVERSTPETLVIASERVLARIAELAARAGLDPGAQVEAARAKQIEGTAEPIAD